MSFDAKLRFRRRRCWAVRWSGQPGKRSRGRSRPIRSDMMAGAAWPPDDRAVADRDWLLARAGDLRPRDDVELYLACCAVVISRKIDRADRPGRTEPADAVLIEARDTRKELRADQLACTRTLAGILEILLQLRQLGEPDASASISAPASAASPQPAGDEPTAPLSRPDADDAGGDIAVREAAPDPAATPIGRRIAGRRHRTPERSAEAGSTPKPAAGPIGRRDPNRRAAREPDPPPSPADARRCVGGYPVPLEPSVSVSRADRAPIWLRRAESGAEFFRPSSPRPLDASLPGRGLAARYSAR